MADRIELTDAELHRRPLPDHHGDTDKHDRGTVLVVGGSRETPGAVLLAGLAALRAGAGRVQIATTAGSIAALGVAIPEARVIALPETTAGAIDPGAASELVQDLERADAVLLGPGTLDRPATEALVVQLLSAIGPGVIVLDANALAVPGKDPAALAFAAERCVLMPNPDEARLLPGDDALSIAEATGTTVAVRGSVTEIAVPGGPVYIDRSGDVGLGMSGSGDVFAGVLAGLCARGADPLTASLWATAAHGRAGERCAERIGHLGYLARELLDELPALLNCGS
ncbi:MAG: hypothetical protein QOG30_2927 [Acidimicrobiaceae bacterium]